MNHDYVFELECGCETLFDSRLEVEQLLDFRFRNEFIFNDLSINACV